MDVDLFIIMLLTDQFSWCDKIPDGVFVLVRIHDGSVAEETKRKRPAGRRLNDVIADVSSELSRPADLSLWAELSLFAAPPDVMMMSLQSNRGQLLPR